MGHRKWEQAVARATYDGSWDFGNTREDLVHRIHTYPAKFPAFITTKAIDYVLAKKSDVKTVGDIFCGCGTTAYEAKKKRELISGVVISILWRLSWRE